LRKEGAFPKGRGREKARQCIVDRASENNGLENGPLQRNIAVSLHRKEENCKK
jgi:hypothetical protein